MPWPQPASLAPPPSSGPRHSAGLKPAPGLSCSSLHWSGSCSGLFVWPGYVQSPSLMQTLSLGCSSWWRPQTAPLQGPGEPLPQRKAKKTELSRCNFNQKFFDFCLVSNSPGGSTNSLELSPLVKSFWKRKQKNQHLQLSCFVPNVQSKARFLCHSKLTCSKSRGNRAWIWWTNSRPFSWSKYSHLQKTKSIRNYSQKLSSRHVKLKSTGKQNDPKV